MRRDLVAVVLGVGAASLGCHTIYEELPTRPGAVNPAPAPVVVVQVPVPSNAPTPAPQPQQPSNPAPAPTQAPSTPTATPAPVQPAPVQQAPEDGDFPNNNAPVAKLGAKIFFVECEGGAVPGSENAGSVPLGCRIHYDCTPKDGANRPTRAKGTPQWTFDPSSLVKVSGRSAYNPVATTIGRGRLCAWAEVDRVRSNDVCTTIN
jgi:hypothetical protein